MRRIALALVLLSCGTAVGLDVPKECFTQNVGGRCWWAAMQTIAKARSLGKLETVFDRRLKAYPNIAADVGSDKLIDAQLTHDEADFVREKHGTFNLETLAKYADSHGVIVTMRPGTNWIRHDRSRPPPRLQVSHAIAIVGWNGETLRFFCSDNPQKIWESPVSWFKDGWQGDSVVVLSGDGQAAP